MFEFVQLNLRKKEGFFFILFFHVKKPVKHNVLLGFFWEEN